MNEIIYLIFRRMRRPALLILICYSVAILGICLIPYLDENGKLARMTLFDGFYWVSYTATTIGYGELPNNFSKLQRVWVVFSIYYLVPVWIYAAGKIIALLSDPLFQSALELNRFTRRTKKLRQRFFLICGFGEAGRRLTRLLAQKGYSCVVIDQNVERIQKISLDPRLYGVLAITGDASDVELLERAGISSPYCRGVIAITNNEEINVQIAIASRLLCSERYRFKIVCRTMSERAFLKAKSFESDLVINTNKVFAERLISSMNRPAINEILQILRKAKRDKIASWQIPHGSWILCGYSSLGQTLEKFLEFEGIDTVVISNNGKEGHIAGSGSEEATLRKANINNASAIVACRKDDAENLSTVMVAKRMRPSLFVVGKQNHSKNAKLFSVSAFDLVMEDSALLVSEIFPFLTEAMLSRFISLTKHQSNAWGEEILRKMKTLFPSQKIDNLALKIDEEHCPALVHYLKSGHILRLQSLWSNNENPSQDFFPLLLFREDKEILLPNPASQVQIGDRFLLIYENKDALKKLQLHCYDYANLYKNIHGKDTIASPVLNYLLKKFNQ